MNYNEELKNILKNLNNRPSLLLHSCCGPCSSYVITFLNDYFDITVLFYNPSIEPKEEYLHRKEEQIKLINNFKSNKKIKFLDSDYDNNEYRRLITNLENEPEGGARCKVCFYQRLKKTSDLADQYNFDYFATTLTVSPHKNPKVINEIGLKLEGKSKYLVSDFKKGDGYKKSIELSKEYNLYRQDYCGCIFSK